MEQEHDNERDDTGKRDRRAGPPSLDRVRLELVLFADLVLRLEKENRLAAELPFILHRMGELRRLLFDYEVRATERLLPTEDPAERAARRLIREVEEEARRAAEEWGGGWTPEGEGEEDSPT